MTTRNMVKFIHKIFKTGRSSLAVVIPREIAKQLRLREKQKVNIYKSGKKIVIEDWE